MQGPPKLDRQFTAQFDEDEPVLSLSPLIRALPHRSVKLKYSMATDIGGGQTNQDSGDFFELDDSNIVVLAVYDGHGRELGELASIVAKDSVRKSLSEPGMVEKLRANSEAVFVDVFQRAHEAIRESFRSKYQELGCEVQDTEDGYLLKRSNANSPWTCTHGGTTATVVVIVDGWRLIVANVGDSTALWGGINSEATVLHRELSAEHSPESVEEFERVRAFRPAHPLSSNKALQQPDMRFVYDAPSLSKSQCPPIFDLDAKTGEIKVTGNGRYYKNVRSEWATLVTTPPNAKFQDALAFTRSLGDLHLHVYGVSCRPAVVEYDLTALHSLCGGEMSALFVCTDGVWDNWKYVDIVAQALSAEMKGIFKTGGSQKATDRLMEVNLRRAKEHFGSQADNMTAVLCYISF